MGLAEGALQPLLELRGIHKSFGANDVLRGIDLQVRPGEVRALLGENGAGKSTLVNIIGGAIPFGSYTGDVVIGADVVHLRSPTDAEMHGVFEVAQELAVVPEMSVVENLFLNRQPRRCGLVDERAALCRAVELAKGMGLSLEGIDLTAPIKTLQPAEQQMICILRAMIGDLRLLILDEPTSRLSDTETEQLFRRIELFRSQGISVLYISHRLAEIRRVADSVTVLRDGMVSLELTDRSQFDERRIVEAMTGQALESIYPAHTRVPVTGTQPALEVRDLEVRRGSLKRCVLSPTSFAVAPGEILGVFGVVGSGTSALVQAMYGSGADSVTGIVRVAGRPIRPGSTADAVAKGLGYIGGDPSDGTFAEMSIEENLGLLQRTKGPLGGIGLLPRTSRAATARQLSEAVSIRSTGLSQRVGTLSGGNRQKVALARWLPLRPTVLLMEDPTRGIDVLARRDVYRSLQALVDQGMAVVLVSSDIDEVLGLADRGLVLRQGTVVDEWSRGSTTSQAVLAAALSADHRSHAEEVFS